MKKQIDTSYFQRGLLLLMMLITLGASLNLAYEQFIEAENVESLVLDLEEDEDNTETELESPAHSLAANDHLILTHSGDISIDFMRLLAVRYLKISTPPPESI